MRETGPVRKQVDGDDEAAIAQMGAARVQLGILKNIMKLGGIPTGTRTIALEDGTQVTVASINGQDSINVVSPAAVATPAEPEVAAEPTPDVELPVVTVPPHNTEKYSPTYLSAVLLGAVTDKTANTVMLAYASPFIDQQWAFYVAPITNSSQLVRLDANMSELGRTAIAQPDWGGQLTYDAATDAFYMNAFTACDDRYESFFRPFGLDTNYRGTSYPNNVPHRSLLMITKDGAQQEVADPVINQSNESYPNTTWGNTAFVQGWTALDTSPGGGAYGVFAFGTDTMGQYGTFGSHRTSQVFPLSQPSTSGLIAAMFQGMGNNSFFGQNWQNSSDMWGYAFLWSTVTQQIVWRGDGLGSFRGAFTDGVGLGSWSAASKFDPWAHVTPSGNAVFSVSGVLTPVQVGSSAFSIGSPPGGIIDIAFTHGDAMAFGITTGGAFMYTARNSNWQALKIDGAPRAVLHDVVTDAVAIVLADASGAWIFNGKSRDGAVLGAFKVLFKRPPVTDPTYIYPQQFINGTLLITYALPWSGARGSTGKQFVYAQTNGNGIYNGIPAAGLGAQRSMGAHYCIDTQRPAIWRAQLGVAGVDPNYEGEAGGNWLPTPNGASDGTVDPVQWIIGRYDIGALKQ